MNNFSMDDIYEQARSFSKAGQFEDLALLMQAALRQVAPESRRSLRIQVRKIVVNNYAVPTAGLEAQDHIDWLAANQDWIDLLEREIESPDRLSGAVGGVVVSMDKFLEKKRTET